MDNVERRDTYLRTGGGYILGTTWKDFYKVGVREPRIPTYRQMILGNSLVRGGGG